MNRRGRIGALAAAAVAALAAAPIAAAIPNHQWVPVCTAEGVRLVAFDAGQDDPDRTPDDGPGGCAHFACPREIRSDGKARARP